MTFDFTAFLVPHPSCLKGAIHGPAATDIDDD